MDSQKRPWVVKLGDASCLDATIVGGKASSLTRLISTGIRVPTGFCLTIFAYRYFLNQSKISKVIQMELGRKPLNQMRWEEIWDAALRIRSTFLRANLRPQLARIILEELNNLNSNCLLAVRSSALGEDSAKGSFAGLHESVVNVHGEESVLQAIRTVWSSLWSDAALLYRKELGLDPLHSGMAVIIQEMVPAKVSGVAFGRDPRNQIGDREIVEAVPGPCSNLVDGLLEPDRWILRRSSGEIMEWHAGKREDEPQDLPLLDQTDLHTLHGRLGQVENLFGWPPDMEWAERDGTLSVLQARPITSGKFPPQSDVRGWYLTLRPKFQKLSRLAEHVSTTLIPELEEIGNDLAKEDIENLNDQKLANCIEERLAKLQTWREVYKEKFIPLAHGVRYLGAYYNEVLRPEDPYEFMMLLQGQDLLALRRNHALGKLAKHLQKNPALLRKLTEGASSGSRSQQEHWHQLKAQLTTLQGGTDFIRDFEAFLKTYMDNTYNGERLIDRPETLLNLVCQLETFANENPSLKEQEKEAHAKGMEDRLVEAVDKSRQHEAKQVIAIGKLSWRLRDDDNILLGRIESQFLRALNLGADRLRTDLRLTGGLVKENSASLVGKALRDPKRDPIHIEEEKPDTRDAIADCNEGPRQLIGQPASPGLAEGFARVVNSIEDFQDFQRGAILVCESIQPTMTHLVPLASAIVERRGGMLIHGAIIARELGIPCVNGVSDASTFICNGDQLSVDGYLGIVSLGAADFELEEQAFEKAETP